MHASPPVDLQQQDSYFIVAHFHYVLFGGAIMGLFAGIYHYWPKMFGWFLNETGGKVSWALMFFGMNVTFFPLHFRVAQGMPRRYYTYDAGVGFETWNLVATIGAFTIAFGMLAFIINVVMSWRNQVPAGDNPWDAGTLEWSMASPPPHYNFGKVPTVHSDRPLWDENHEGGPIVSQAKLVGDHAPHVKMPPPSYWPLFAAISLVVVWAGFLFGHGSYDGTAIAFDSGNFMIQVLVSGIGAVALLGFFLAWIREDFSVR
jgi:cytochrome c oxidase subunit 1